jgi:hypothetical protein
VSAFWVLVSLAFLGFFYQRIVEELEGRDRSSPPESPPGNVAA